MIEPLSGYCHLKTLVASRLCTFADNPVACKKFPVRFLARINSTDKRTVLGRNLASIERICGVRNGEFESLSSTCVKKSMVYKKVNEEDAWKVVIAKELIDINCGEAPVPVGFSSQETREILDYVRLSPDSITLSNNLYITIM